MSKRALLRLATISMLALSCTTGIHTASATLSDEAVEAASRVSPRASSSVLAEGGFFSPPTAVPLASGPIAIARGDLDGDGRMDLAVATQAGVAILRGTGDGTFQTSALLPTGPLPSDIAAADLDGDGRLDLAVSSIYAGEVWIYLGSGDGSFAVPFRAMAGPAPMALALGDLDGDGKPDLVVANGTSNGVVGQTLTILRNRGAGGFTPSRTYFVGANPRAVAAVDIDGDGKLDLLAANTDANTITVLLGNGDGSFRFGSTVPVHGGPNALAIADFNGDGKPDVAVTNGQTSDLSIVLGTGAGGFGAARHVALGALPSGIATVDFDADGRIDLAITHYFDATVTLLQGGGDGTFLAAGHLATAAGPQHPIAADVNGDAATDIVVAANLGGVVDVALGKAAVRAPAALRTRSGTPQSTPVGTMFATRLSVVVEDESQHPLSNIAVDFALDGGGGASGVFAGGASSASAMTDALGIATAPPLGANAIAGSHRVIASTGALRAIFELTNVAAGVAPTFTSGAPPPGSLQTPYVFALTASGSPSPSFAVAGGSLPPGIVLAVTGVLSGTPASTGIYAGRFSASNGVPPDAVQSFEIVVGVATQTIDFAALPDVSLDTPPFRVVATATSNLPVVVSSLTPRACVAQEATVTLLAAGPCRLRASQEGDGRIARAVDVERTFMIARGTQSIAFAPLEDRALGSPMHPMSAVASSRLPVAFASLTPDVCEAHGYQLAIIAIGACTIRASQPGNSNYDAAMAVDRSFSVTRSPQTITFWPPGNVTVASGAVGLSANASSSLPVTFESLSPSVCEVSGPTARLRAVGRCMLRLSQAGNSAYLAVSIEAGFEVVSAPGATLPPGAGAAVIEYATYLGGYGSDRTFDVAVDGEGAAFVAGSVASTNFPSISSSRFTNAGVDLSFVARTTPEAGALDFALPVGARNLMREQTGSLDYADGDLVEAMAIDPSGVIHVAAYENSTEYPQLGGTYVRAGPKRIFRLAGQSVQAASMPLDPAIRTIRAIAVDAAGAIYVSGVAAAGLGTTPGAAIPRIAGTGEAPYLLKLASGGHALVFATYLSAPGSRNANASVARQSSIDNRTTAYALAIDSGGSVYVAGQAAADDFPVSPGAADTDDREHRDAFVAKVDARGTAILFVARLGGSDAERATSVALTRDGSIVIGGKTATLPFRGWSQQTQDVVHWRDGVLLVNRETGFVAKLSADGARWIWVAPIGTSGGNLVAGAPVAPSPLRVAVDSKDFIYVAGTTLADRSLPVANPIPGVRPDGAFLMKMPADGSEPVFATPLGGGVAAGLAVDAEGSVYVTGRSSGGLPMARSAQASPMFESGFATPFLIKLGSAPIALTASGSDSSTPGPLHLTATLASPRYAGMVEFNDGTTTLGRVPVQAGVAVLDAALAPGVHRLHATFSGAGPFSGYRSPELIHRVDQAAAGH